MDDNSCSIEMQTIQTNITETPNPAFKILIDTVCVKKTRNNRYRRTSTIVKNGEIYRGGQFMYKNRIYIDISHCYNQPLRTTCIPLMFDLNGKYIINVREYRGPSQF
jgi:hypothetical protein